MKPSRDEVLKAAMEAGFVVHPRKSQIRSPFDSSGDSIDAHLERFAAAMYEAGAAAERAELERKVEHLDLMDRVQIRQIGLLEARIKAERAVSDRLLAKLMMISIYEANGSNWVRQEARAAIAEVEAMRKEQE